jgi:uncharacterized protein YdeI (YjbR/CyaY-like superfamily)
MNKKDKLDLFYDEEHPFKNGVNELRLLAIKSGLTETFKWSFPTYTKDDKNIVAICKFKAHFGIWFFNGVFLTDPENILENVQEGKTKAIRHWKFNSTKNIDQTLVNSYFREAIENNKKGLRLKPKRTNKEKFNLPSHFSEAFITNIRLKNAFYKLNPYKQREFGEYIETAKQEKTKQARLEKIVPMILEGKGLNDLYR